MKLNLLMAVTMFGFVLLVAVRAYRSRRRPDFKQTWVDGLLVNLFASSLVVLFAYVFRKQIFIQFQKPRVSMESHCRRLDNPRKDLYDCKVTLTNETELQLSEHKFIIDSSKDFRNYNFVSCDPTKRSHNTVLTVDTKSNGEATCAFRIDLKPFEKSDFNLELNGDTNDPSLDILQ